MKKLNFVLLKVECGSLYSTSPCRIGTASIIDGVA